MRPLKKNILTYPRVIISLSVLFQVFVVCRTPFSFWFEDDPVLVSFTSLHPHPFVYFFSPTLLQVPVVGALQPLPFQNFGYWIDSHLMGASPVGAYLHSAIFFWFSALLLFQVLSYFMERKGALLLTTLWQYLPVSIVLLEFVATRNYLYGFTFSLLAFWAAQQAVARKGDSSRLGLIAMAFLCLCAALSKQIYLTSTFPLIFGFLWYHRHWKGVGVMIATGAAYLSYVYWLTGLKNNYDGLSAQSSEYFTLLGAPVYQVTASVGGYALLAFFCLAFFRCLNQKSKSYRGVGIWDLGLFWR